MTLTGWLIFLAVIQVVHAACTWKMYVAAGRQAWEAAIPVYNAVVLMKIINRPWWWVILLFAPIVNLIMIPVTWVETLRSFGFNSNKDTFLALLSFGLYLGYINYTQELKHIPDRDLRPRTKTGEWVSSILFAVVAATMVHTYFMQPYTIPTGSLEKTLLIGDYLFVSKFHYGARAPMTAVTFPMVHDKLPLLNKKSYVKDWQYPYMRLPGFQQIKRNDIVVFGWPVDTLVDINNPYGEVDIKPMDKKTNYVKRCVGVPGDSLEIRNGHVYIDGAPNVLPDRARLQFHHTVQIEGNPGAIVNKYDLDVSGAYQPFYTMSKSLWNDSRVQQYLNNPGTGSLYLVGEVDSLTVEVSGYTTEKFINDMKLQKVQDKINFNLTEEKAALLAQDPAVKSVSIYQQPKTGDLFPQHPAYDWDTNNFGPIYIPKAGETVAIDALSIPFYKRIIEVYEGSELGIENKISQAGTQVLLNGQPITEYTFVQDYYWMMGDNRNNSQDARSWGFVPFNHVVGKPVFIWMSLDQNGSFPGNIRWERVFTTVGGDGQPVSYFKYFLVALALWFGINYFRKKKKAKKAA